MKQRIIYCKVNEEPKLAMVDLNLDTMQKLVGGLIECVALDAMTDLWANEEGRVLGLPPNRLIEGVAGMYDICGDFFVCCHTDEGDSIGMSEDAAFVWLARIARAPTAQTFYYGGFGGN